MRDFKPALRRPLLQDVLFGARLLPQSPFLPAAYRWRCIGTTTLPIADALRFAQRQACTSPIVSSTWALALRVFAWELSPTELTSTSQRPRLSGRRLFVSSPIVSLAGNGPRQLRRFGSSNFFEYWDTAGRGSCSLKANASRCRHHSRCWTDDSAGSFRNRRMFIEREPCPRLVWLRWLSGIPSVHLSPGFRSTTTSPNLAPCGTVALMCTRMKPIPVGEAPAELETLSGLSKDNPTPIAAKRFRPRHCPPPDLRGRSRPSCSAPVSLDRARRRRRI